MVAIFDSGDEARSTRRRARARRRWSRGFPRRHENQTRRVQMRISLQDGSHSVMVVHMFKRWVVGWYFVAVACGKTETSSPPTPTPTPTPTPVVADAAPKIDAPKPPPPIPDPPNRALVKPAFGGTVPELPQLSRDGASAAVD